MWITKLLGFHGPAREVTLRCDRSTFAALRQHAKQDPTRVQLAFGLAEPSPTAIGLLLKLWDLFLPGPEDVSIPTRSCAAPTRSAQALVYLAAEQTSQSLVSFQVRPTIDMPALSEADRQQGRQSAAYLRRKFARPVSLATVVFNRDFTTVDGEVYGGEQDTCQRIDRIEILGRPSIVLSVQSYEHSTGVIAPNYDRERRLPELERHALQTPRVSLIGLDRKGSHVLPSLIEMGLGMKGWIAGIDPQPFYAESDERMAYPIRKGLYKVDAAAEFVRRANPAARFVPLRNWLMATPAEEWFKASTLAIIASDDPSQRETANLLAIRYGIPLVDLGQDVQSDRGTLPPPGQVRVTIPGETGCSACQKSVQAAEPPQGELDREGLKRLLADAYLQSLLAPATPALAGLDALIAAYAVNAVLGIILGPGFGAWDELHFDLDQGVTRARRIAPCESCPTCGPAAIRHPSWIRNIAGLAGPKWVPMTPDTGLRDAVSGDSVIHSTEGVSHA